MKLELNPIPIAYCSTTVLIVDDNPDFLDSIFLLLDQNDLRCKTTYDPEKALTFIQSNSSLANQYQNNDLDTLLNQSWFNQTMRFSEISLIIIDYNMPRISGIEFCTSIRDLPIKKLLMTGAHELKEVNLALEQGIIDEVLIKTASMTFIDNLRNTIDRLRWNYFQTLSEPFFKQLPLASCLPEPVFQDLFQHVMEQYKIVEFCLVDPLGSFLFRDNNKQCYQLTIQEKPTLTPLIGTPYYYTITPKNIF